MAAILTLIKKKEQFFTTSKIQHQLIVNTSFIHHKKIYLFIYHHINN